jgi:protein O-GlcNAc transferase
LHEEQHLLLYGVKRVAFIAKPLSAYAVLARIAGYPKSLFAYGIPHQQNLVCRGNPDDPGFIQKVFRDCRPEASVCANDFTAARVLAGLVSHGIRVPEEIRIVGIDDVKYSGLLPVPLTTQHQNCADIGAMAMVTMLQRVKKLTHSNALTASLLPLETVRQILTFIHDYNHADMQFLRARSLFLFGIVAAMLPSAQGQTPTAPAANPKVSANARLKLADEAFRAGSAAYLRNDLHSAHIQFAKVVQLAPGVAAGHTAFGTVLLAEGDVRSAMKQLELAHGLDPRDAAATLNLALAYSQLHDYMKSVQMFQLLDQTKSGEPQTLTPQAAIAYAVALAATGEHTAAQKQLEAALATSPDDPALHDALGTLLAQKEQYDPAVVQFRRAISLDPELPSAHYHLGSVFLIQGNPAAAVTELTQANELAKENIEYALQLGRALRADHQDESALAVLRHALKLDPASIEAKYELALTLQANDNAQEALPLFQQVVTARPKDFAALTNLGLALVQTGDAKGAIPFYLRALALNEQSATLREDLGVAYLQQSDLNHAIEQFRAGVTVEPDNPQLHYDLGLALKLKDNPPAAVSEFEQAEKLDPQLPDPPYTLGVLYMQLGRFAEARAELEKATALRPDNGEDWAILGNVYKDTNEPQKGAAALRRAIELMPNQPSPHISLAAILIQQGDAAGAAAERKKAADLSRIAVSRQRANFALDSGKTLLKRRQVAEALVQFQTAVEADPNYAEAHSALADALNQQGRSAAAALERQKAEKLTTQPGASGGAAPAHP